MEVIKTDWRYSPAFNDAEMSSEIVFASVRATPLISSSEEGMTKLSRIRVAGIVIDSDGSEGFGVVWVTDGELDGLEVTGFGVGSDEGDVDGLIVIGLLVGRSVTGFLVGDAVDGRLVGLGVTGFCVGCAVTGLTVGDLVGCEVTGFIVGALLGLEETGFAVGKLLGLELGD